jgi:hypothetical protein
MTSTYRIYGNSDPSPEGFPTPESIQDYIGGGIFNEHQGRYRYSQATFADKIVLSRKGIAYGHFDLARAEDPTQHDLASYSKTKKAFTVTKSTLYDTPVKLFRKSSPSSGPQSFRYKVGQAGLEISERDFNKILREAGKVEVFEPGADGANRYCRICYNSNGWRKPSGTADEHGSTYYGQHGFGHEEWLFNYEWCINGFKYGFLQPINRNLTTYQGSTFSLKLYTNLAGRSFYAGTIDRVYVPHDDELEVAFDEMRANGWFEQMRTDVAALPRGDVNALTGDIPSAVINVRFDPADVKLILDMPEFSVGSKPMSTAYYMLLHDDGASPPRFSGSDGPKKRSELQFLRAAQQGTSVDPAHARLQNKLYDWLCEQHGSKAVGLEVEFVDLRLTLGDEITFFEIKTDSSAKRCIRNAIGQLFEYAKYATESKAHRWIVVGDPVPTASDGDYLKHLRDEYGIPLYYAQFDWESGSIGEPH